MSNSDKTSGRILGRALTRELSNEEVSEVSGGGDNSAALEESVPTKHTLDGTGQTWTDTGWDDYWA